jgi:hypothetical protein
MSNKKGRIFGPKKERGIISTTITKEEKIKFSGISKRSHLTESALLRQWVLERMEKEE